MCNCGKLREINRSINIFDTHILVVISCACGRRIHKDYNLKKISIFHEEKIETNVTSID